MSSADATAATPWAPAPSATSRLRIRSSATTGHAVADPKGTAYATVYRESMPIAGKTGTAETGGDRPSHAWFAGYAPADTPRIAFVIAIEYASDAATAADWGLVNTVASAEALDAATDDLVATILAKNPDAIRRGKKLFKAGR